MLCKQTHILLFLLTSILSGCQPYIDSFILHGRYVDYECNPLKNKEIVVHGTYLSALQAFSWSGPSHYVSVVTTNDNGEFTAWARGERLSVSPKIPDARYYRHGGARSFGKKETKLLKDRVSSKNPLVIYTDENYKQKRRTKYHYNRIIKIRDGELQLESKGIPASSSSGYGIGYDIYYRWGHVNTVKERISIFDITMYSGGLNEVDRANLPFKAHFPEEGYVQSVRLRLNNTPGEHIRKSYYYYSQHKKRWGTLILDLVWVDDSKYVMNMVFDHLRNNDEGGRYVETLVLSVPDGGFVEKYRTPRKIIEQPDIPPSKCGGALSYDHDGYYANDFRIPIKTKSTIESENKIAKTSSNPVKQNSKNDPPPSLDNYDNVSQVTIVLWNKAIDKHLIEKIYYHYKSKDKIKVGSIFHEIARHPNTPDYIIAELIQQATLSNGYDVQVAKNVNLSRKNIMNLVKNHVSWETVENLVSYQDLNEHILLLLIDGKYGLSSTAVKKLIFSDKVTARALDKIVNRSIKDKTARPDTLSLAAWSKKSSPSALSKIYKYNSERKRPAYEIWNNLSYNPSTPEEILNELSKIIDIHIMTGVFCNKNSTKSVKNKLYNKDRLDCLPYGKHHLMVP